MTTDQIEALIKSATDGNQRWLILYSLLTIVGSALAAFGGAFFAEKGKNRATKEDIAGITDKIESVKADYAHRIEELKGTYQLHAVSTAKRLEALQGAYIRWTELIHSVYSPKLQEEARACSQWLTQNCVYLPSSVRDALGDAIIAAMQHEGMLGARLPRVEIDANWSRIRCVADIIMREANLPPIPSRILDKIEQREKA